MSGHGNASVPGQLLELAGAAVPLFPRDLDPAAMQRWIEPAGRSDLRERLRRAFKEAPTFVVGTVKILTVTCHGNATASQLIAQGGYTWVNPHITDERFPIVAHDPVTDELEFFQFVDRDPSWEEVLAERTRRNLNEPTFEHGFELGIQHRDEQHQHPIVITHDPVLGPDGHPRVLVLYGGADYRELGLYYTRSGWGRDCVFAGVRPSTSPAGGAGQAS